MHPGIWIGGLSGLCAGMGLIVSLARSIYRAATEASANAARIESLITEAGELREAVARHTTELAVLTATRPPRRS
jgi:hypothetical protein